MYGGGGWKYDEEIADDQYEDLHDLGDKADQMWGNSGNDIMYGNLGNDEIRGNTGDDSIEGNDGSDTIRGGPGDDHILGGTNEEKKADTGDFLYGDEGSDYIEGNAGSDTIYGGPGDDDIIGGSNAAGEADLGDYLYGQEGADTILGDNGEIVEIDTPGILVYQLEEDTFGNLQPLHAASGISSSRTNREVVMLDEAEDLEIGNIAGSDVIYGGAGDDQIFGQFEERDQPGNGDTLYGEGGQDLIVGDQGTASCSVNTGTNQEVLRTNAPFLIDDIFVANTLYCVADLTPTDSDGDDKIRGGDNADWLFGVGGIDLINGDSGNDRIFGGNGDDHLWGGDHHDHLWGGDGEDFLDVYPREAYTKKVRGQMVTIEADPPIYFEWAGEEPLIGMDYMYGGLGRDAMQADNSEKGRNPGDRMIDWLGVYNIYYLCTAQYGESVITRSPSPQVINFLVELARSDGAAAPDVPGSSGFIDIGIVYRQDYRDNSHPPHDDTPGHFTCAP
jgi:Ca2+-binding RTX toxin-like protein